MTTIHIVVSWGVGEFSDEDTDVKVLKAFTSDDRARAWLRAQGFKITRSAWERRNPDPAGTMEFADIEMTELDPPATPINVGNFDEATYEDPNDLGRIDDLFR